MNDVVEMKYDTLEILERPDGYQIIEEIKGAELPKRVESVSVHLLLIDVDGIPFEDEDSMGSCGTLPSDVDELNDLIKALVGYL